jgi:membrane protein DedA with SNARE-associated domain
VWFGLITFLAFRAGDNWDLVEHYIVRSGKVAGLVAVAIVVVAVGIWLWKRQAKKRE